jgi:hypothetical protein
MFQQKLGLEILYSIQFIIQQSQSSMHSQKFSNQVQKGNKM